MVAVPFGGEGGQALLREVAHRVADHFLFLRQDHAVLSEKLRGQPDAGDDQQAADEHRQSEPFVEQDSGLQHGEDRDEVDEYRSPGGAEAFDAVGEPGEAEGGAADRQEDHAGPHAGDHSARSVPPWTSAARPSSRAPSRLAHSVAASGESVFVARRPMKV